jgi:NADPH:quinone reductase-like Zn-dependent oxidoreductase
MDSKMSRRTMLQTTGGALAMAVAPVASTIASSAAGKLMRAAVVTRAGDDFSTSIRVVEDWPEPHVGDGQARVRTEASALNHVDLWLGQSETKDFPHITGSDGCGTVEAVGEGVDTSWIGRRVIFNAALPSVGPVGPDERPEHPPEIDLIGSKTAGSMAEKFVVPAANLLDVGDADPIMAAAFSLTFLTAWRMISSRARLRPDQTVLLTGIGGGVALAALKIVLYTGSAVIVTSRHRWKLDRARELGATHTILDEGQDWSETVRTLTGGRGVDLCVDSVGKVLHGRCIRSLAQGGSLTICGSTTGSDPETLLGDIFWKQLNVLGSSMGSMDEFREVTALFRAGRLEPVIDRVFPFADAPEAYARLQAGDQFGKVVIRWG